MKLYMLLYIKIKDLRKYFKIIYFSMKKYYWKLDNGIIRINIIT